jgi:hypothetical protein
MWSIISLYPPPLAHQNWHLDVQDSNQTHLRRFGMKFESPSLRRDGVHSGMADGVALFDTVKQFLIRDHIDGSGKRLTVEQRTVHQRHVGPIFTLPKPAPTTANPITRPQITKTGWKIMGKLALFTASIDLACVVLPSILPS